MAHRSTVNTGKDAMYFHNTANRVKKINVSPKTMRGGIRL